MLARMRALQSSLRFRTHPLLVPLAAVLGACVACNDAAQETIDSAGDSADAAVDTASQTPADTKPADAAAEVLVGTLCVADHRFCTSARESAMCNATGDAIASTAPCTGATACEPSTGLCRATICEPEKLNCLDLHRYQVCAGDGSTWGETLTCADPMYCADGRCRACVENTVECLSDTTYKRCAEDASAWSGSLACGNDFRCIGKRGEEPAGCKHCGLENVCVDPTLARAQCSSGEVTWQEDHPCTSEQTCQEGFCRACTPKALECLTETSYRTCDDLGQGWSTEVACPAEQACFDTGCRPYACSPRVLLLVDYSGSMGPHWDAAKRAVTAIIQANPELRFGMKTFPDAETSNCTVGPDLEIPFAAGSAQTFSEWFESHDPPGSTPLAEGIMAMERNAEAVFGPLGGSMIVLTDGQDSCYWSQNPPIEVTLAEKTASLYINHKVKTYAIGFSFNGDFGELDTIAHNGATDFPDAIAAGNEAELTTALKGIIDRVKFCQPDPQP